jgi:site-specific DNA-methyltransferase (adenine-specific)
MAERKNVTFDRPGGYAMPKGATAVQRRSAAAVQAAAEAGEITLFGDGAAPVEPKRIPGLKPDFQADDPDTRLYIGDCRDVLPNLPEQGQVDLVFADPPFNWEVPYAGDTPGTGRGGSTQGGGGTSGGGGGTSGGGGGTSGGWKDGMPRREYERFTFDWLDGCINCLAPHGSIFVNIPDDTAAEAVIHLKRRGLTMINWCIWHFRFGQHRDSSFIMSKVHVLYFAKDPSPGGRIWNGPDILEMSDRAAIYGDPRTMTKASEHKGMRVPMDVWYGKYWGRIQGNNKERRHNHHNQIPEVYLERVIRACSNVGSLVLDPFCGSGTTSTVARALGRRSITIEYSRVNAESAWERITKVGMVPREDSGGPQSTAIFPRRSVQGGKQRAAALFTE